MIIKALAILMLLPSLIYTQNLVPNPSFEALKSCPTGDGQVALADPWEWVLTPDLFSACATNPSLVVPEIRGCQYLPARTGENYVGMYVLNSKEFVKVRLVDTLEAGKYYYARFFVAPDEDCIGGIPESFTDAIAIGVKPPGPSGEFKIVAENAGTVIRDTAKWTKVSGCFQANGDELVLQIGNFKEDSQTLLETNMPQVPNNQQFNYMFVDDVLLEAFDPFPDTVLMCNGSPVNLDASFHEANFEWTTGDTSAATVAFDTGKYVVTAHIDGCVLQEKVTVVNLDYNSLMPSDTSICKGDEIKLSPNIPGTYLWGNGSRSQQLTAKQAGTYEATISNICGDFKFQQKVITDDCRCRIYVPTIFSPNGDGINDLLEIGMGCDFEYETKHLEIFDRWGNSVFATNKIGQEKWDGYYRGKLAQQGVYTWFLTYNLMYEGSLRAILEEGSVILVY